MEERGGRERERERERERGRERMDETREEGTAGEAGRIEFAARGWTLNICVAKAVSIGGRCVDVLFNSVTVTLQDMKCFSLIHLCQSLSTTLSLCTGKREAHTEQNAIERERARDPLIVRPPLSSPKRKT